MRGRALALILFCLLGLSSCAAVVKTEGTSGPIAWRATDFKAGTRQIQGQSVDTSEFTLVVRNVSDKAITLTRMDRIVYQPGMTAGQSSFPGRWELAPGAERKFPLYSFRQCLSSEGCHPTTGTQMLWQITFTGTDAQNRPVEARMDIAPPPLGTTTADLSATRRNPAAGEVPPLRASMQSVGLPTTRLTSLAGRLPDAPAWRVGYGWEFRFESTESRGTFVWSVDREELVDGVPNYVITTENREIFYRKADIATTRETVDGAPVLLSMPPRLRYVFPLEVGKTWEQALREDRPSAGGITERVDVVTVEAEETITVPAGTFRTLKLVYRNKRTGAIRYEEWYSPEVRQWVRLRENLAAGLRVRELLAVRLQ